MDQAIQETLIGALAGGGGDFVRAVFSGQQRGAQMRWERLVIRPVEIKNQRLLQLTYFDGKQTFTENHTPQSDALKDVLALPFRHFRVETTGETLEVRATKRGKLLLSRGKATTQTLPDTRHDRAKNVLLAADDTSSAYLKAVGIMSEDGRIKAKMHPKYRQINKFLELVESSGAFKHLPAGADAPLRIVDAGCGNAYLTFALYHYLTAIKGQKVALTGIDINGHLLTQHRHKTESLGWQDGLTFAKSTIIDYVPDTLPDMVIALHACDTATDDAIAQGIRWGCGAIICAPCCHHHMQAQLSAQTPPEPFASVLRHGILHERMGDMLTDSFRALILRIMGYRTDIVQFVDAEHTPKNLMIRAVKTSTTGSEQALAEYRALKAYWGVTPYLEDLLGEGVL